MQQNKKYYKPYPQRKKPVHPPPIVRSDAPVILFVTIVIKPRIPALNNNMFHHAWPQACFDADAWMVGRYVIMPDHIHFFCSPNSVKPIRIKPWSSYLKRMVTQKYEHKKWKWQSDCWDTQMRTQQQYEEKWIYVRGNPVRKKLVTHVDDWPYQGELNQLIW